MKELDRLRDDRTADPELARLFRAGSKPTPISPAALVRSRRRVLGLVAAPAAFGALAWVQHAALGAALGTAVAVAAALPRLVAERPGPAGAASALAPRPPSTNAAVPSAEVPVPTSLRSDAPAPAPARIPALASSEENPLLRETALLENARAELDRRPATSLRLLAQHEREFAQGTLALERDFLTVAALLRLGERARAEARGATLRQRSPASLYAQRLDRLLGDGGVER